MSEAENVSLPVAPKNLVRKLAEVMGKIDRVKKRGHNTHFDYDFATESDITDALRAHLAAAGVMIIPTVDSVELGQPFMTKGGSQQWITTVWLQFTFADAESGETWTVRWPGQGQDGGDKGVYKSVTGALKFLLLKTFLISTGDAMDPETDTHQDQRTQTEAASPATRRETRESKQTDDVTPEVRELSALIVRLTELDSRITPDGVIGAHFKTKAGKTLRWDEVRAFHTDRQLKWVRGGIAAVRKQYQELLSQRPEDVSQEPEQDLPF